MSRVGSIRLWCCLIGVSVAASAEAAPAVAAGPPRAPAGPVAAIDDLWEEYPLDAGRAEPGATGSSPERTGTERGADTGDEPPATGVDPDPTAMPVQSPVETEGDSAPVVPILISLGVLAAAVVLATALARRRGSPLAADTAQTPVPARADVVEPRHRVYVEGSTAREGIGKFSGYVHATVVGDEPTNDFLCLGDPDSDGALWVRRWEITSMRAPYAETIDDRAAPSGPFQRPAGTPSRPTRA